MKLIKIWLCCSSSLLLHLYDVVFVLYELFILTNAYICMLACIHTMFVSPGSEEMSPPADQSTLWPERAFVLYSSNQMLTQTHHSVLNSITLMLNMFYGNAFSTSWVSYGFMPLTIEGSIWLLSCKDFCKVTAEVLTFSRNVTQSNCNFVVLYCAFVFVLFILCETIKYVYIAFYSIVYCI